MRTPLLFAAIAVFPFVLTSQTATLDWVHAFGDTDSDITFFVQTDAAGNSYSAGSYQGAFDFDPGPGNTTIYSQEQAVFIQKLDPEGNLIWVKTLAGNTWKNISAMHLSDDGTLCFGGNFYGTLDIDPGSGVFEVTASGSMLYFAKLDISGNFLCGGSFGGQQENTLSCITADQDGNLLLTGYFAGVQCDFNPGPGIANLNSAGDLDSYILKLDANGSFVWVKRIGGGDFDMARSLVTDDQHNIYIAGSFQSTVDFNPGNGSYLLQATGNTDAFLLKLDSNGSYLWVKAINGSYAELALYVALDLTGAVYLTGRFNSPDMDLDPGADTVIAVLEGYDDLFLVKLTADGDFTWGTAFGHPDGYVSPNVLSVSPENNVLVAGGSNVSFDADPGPGTTFTEHAEGGFLLLLSAGGAYIWNESFAQGGADFDFFLCNDVAFDPSGNLYIAGAYNGTIDADPGAGETLLTSIGYADAFLIKQQFVLGIGKPENTIGKICPNPFSETTMVTLDRPVDGATVEIICMNGKTARLVQHVSGTEIELKREQLPAGMYLVRVLEDNRTIAMERIVVLD